MLRGVDFVSGFDEEEERVIGVFGFRDESGVVDEVSRDQIWGSDERAPGFGDALESNERFWG